MTSKTLQSLLLGSLALASLVGLSSCNSTIDVDQERRSENERAFRSFADSAYTKATVPGIGGSGFVYLKVEKEGDKSIGVDYTDAVELFRDTYRTTDWIKDKFKATRLRQTLDMNAIEQEPVANRPVGLQIAVQNLHQGAEATIVIPWYLNNTTSTSERTDSYTSLYYRVRLKKVIKPSTK